MTESEFKEIVSEMISEYFPKIKQNEKQVFCSSLTAELADRGFEFEEDGGSEWEEETEDDDDMFD